MSAMSPEAAQPTTLKHAAQPQLALVFGSGGVKSVAALGVAEVLEQEGLRPDLVVGCSAGAIFGTLVAARLPGQECRQLATTLWSREVTSLRRHQAWAQAAMAPVFTALSKNFEETFALRDDRLILQRMRQAFGEQRLEDLPTPMVVNTTDAASGESVLLRSGSVCDALRASVALPFLFAPWRVDGQLLVDGSVSDPLPVGAASGAKVVLALGFEVPTPRQVSGPTRLATRITASLTNNLMQARLASHARPQMIALLPRLERRVGLFDTDAMPYLIEVGRQQARAVLPRLHALLAQRETGQGPAGMRHLREVRTAEQAA